MTNKVGAGIGILLVNQEGKILLGKRHDDPEKADSELHGEGTWTMPGGGLERGESIEGCAIREVLEETGIKINDLKVICVNNDKNEHAHFVTIGLFSDDFEGEPQVLEPDEITEWKWFDLNDLPENMFFCSRKLLDNYLQKSFYIKPKEIQLGKYQHYKGNFYELINLGTHSDTLEEYVVYRGLYDCPKFGKNPIWVKSKEEFCMDVIVDGKEVPRFKFVGGVV